MVVMNMRIVDICHQRRSVMMASLHTVEEEEEVDGEEEEVDDDEEPNTARWM